MADITITAANVKQVAGSTQTTDDTAGEAVTAGQWCYIKSSDGKAYKADVDTTTAEANVKGMALNDAAADQPVKLAIGGNVDVGSVLTAGETYVLSDDGAMAPIGDLLAGDIVTILGVALDADTLHILKYASGVTL